MEDEFDRALKAAENAHDREDWLAAIEHWKDCIRLNPTFFESYWIGGGLLLQYGRLEEAEALLSKGVAINPTHIPMAVTHARAATSLKNWPEAVRRWNALSRRAPDDKDVIEGRAAAEMQIRLHRIDKAEGARDSDWKRFQAGRITSAETDLFMQFQSLGDNCEFGLVQRHFLAEPVSLLRWSSISMASLIAGMADGFKNVGHPENTKLMVGAEEEYVLHDDRYNMAMHTFLKKHLVFDDPDDLYKKMCNRQTYLGRQLREDLEDPDQIFVYKSVSGATIDDAKALHSVMERHGPNNLLVALEADDHRVSGSVEQLSTRLFVGSIGRFSHPGEGWENLDFASWRSVCADVVQRVRQAKGASGLFKRAFRSLWH